MEIAMNWMNDPKKINETMEAVDRLVDTAEEDARACADIMQDYYPHIEICEGYPGHWLTVEVR